MRALAMRKVALLVQTWLVLDFFGDARRDGRESSALSSAIFGQSFLAFALAAIVFEKGLPLERFAAINLSLSTLLLGVAALADPDREARRLADRQLFGTAPLGRVTLGLARAAHGLTRTALLALGMAIPPAVLCTFLGQGSLAVLPAYLLLAVLLAGLVSGALQIAVRAVARRFGSLQAALSAGTVRAILLGAGLAGFVLGLPALRTGRAALPLPASLVDLWPPFCAARWLADPQALDAALVLAVCALLLLALDAVVGDLVREERGGTRRARSPFAWLDAKLAGEGPLRGVSTWTASMLFRSAAFRGRVLPLAGLPAAMLLLTFASEDRAGRELLLGVALQLPAMGMPFLVAFLPRAEQDGADLVFRTCPHGSRALAREGALLALTTRVVLPLQLIAAPCLVMLDGSPARVLGLVGFSSGLAVFATAHALRALDAVAFTAIDDDPRGLELGALVPPTLLLAGLGAAYGSFADHAAAPLVAALVLAMAIRRLVISRRRSARTDA